LKTFKVAVARFPGSGSERMEAVGWLIRTVAKMKTDPRISDVHSICIATTPITMGRNRAVKEAKEAGCHYLLMIDSDMSPDLPCPGSKPFWDEAWEFMMMRRDAFDEFGVDYPPATIAAPYCGPPPEECVFVFQWATYESDLPDANFRLEMVPREMAAIKQGIQEAAALPTGLILYDMRVFDVLPHPWFEYEYTTPEKTHLASTEDVYQTRNASMLKMPQFCAWSSWAGHVKTKVVGKPTIVTADMVHQSLRDAVLRGHDSRDRMIVLPKQNGAPTGETFSEVIHADPEWRTF
jgi:hypothetical protein